MFTTASTTATLVTRSLEGREELPNYDKYRGEVLFMRSWWYFNLYRAFGVVITRTVVHSLAAAKLIPPLYVRRCTP